MKNRIDETEYYFVIVLKETSKVIGEIDGYLESSDPHDPYPQNDTFSPCWMLNLEY